MLVQLKCRNCDSILKTEPDGKTFVCEACGSRYILALDAGYIKGNKIVLLGGGYQSLNIEQHSYGNGPIDLYSSFPVNEKCRKQMDQDTAELQYEISEGNERERRRLADVDQKAYWIRNKLCRHCGGEFEGRIFKRCMNCGKSKDY